MNEGALAFLDCLGLKGIWKDAGTERVVAKLSAVERGVIQRVRDIRNSAPPWFPTIRFTVISDTVVIAVHTAHGAELPDIGKGSLVRIAAVLSLVVARELINGDLPRALRGCITYGQFVTAGDFVVGPAVDEAATAGRLADGAFVWLMPEARRLLDLSTAHHLHQLRRHPGVNVADTSVNDLRAMGEQALADVYARAPQEAKKALGELLRETLLKNGDLLVLRNYPVSMKGSGPISCHVANPCTQCTAAELESQDVVLKYQRAMESADLSADLKSQTEIMLRSALEQMRPYREGLARLRERFGLRD